MLVCARARAQEGGADSMGVAKQIECAYDIACVHIYILVISSR